MIEHFLEKLIEELGATGLLVIGLYFLLYRPLVSMAKHLRMINHEVGQILMLFERHKADITPKKIIEGKDAGD